MKQTNWDGKEVLLVEKWKDVKGYKGLYKISSIGRVKSYHRGKEAILKPFIHPKSGRASFPLYINKKGKWHKRARLIAEAFIPNPFNLKTVNHINGDKLDDRIENLEWMSLAENIRHGHRNKLFTYWDRAAYKKPVIQMDLDGNFIARFDCIKAASTATNIVGRSISKMCKGGKSKWRKADGSIAYTVCTHAGGFKWKFDTPLLLMEGGIVN